MCHNAYCVDLVVRVYVGDLGNNGDPDELRRMFSRYGSVQDVWVAHKPPGFAFVFYRTVREAREAVKGANGRMVCGVRVRVRMGTEMNQSEAPYQGRSFEREYDSPPRERSRAGSSYQGRSHQQSQPRGPRHSERSSRNYVEHSPPRPSPPHSSWSSKGSHRSIPHSHPSSMGHSFSSRSHAEDLYSSPPSHSKYGGHKKGYEATSHYSSNDRYSSREGGSRITSRPRYTSPDRLPRFSPPADTAYHGSRRGNNRFERHELQQFDYKDKAQRSRHKEHVYPKISSHRHHRSRSPHSFSPPPVRQLDRRHGNKGGWSYGNHSPPPQPPSRRPHYDDTHDHHGYRERASRDDQFEARSFSSDRAVRGSRKEYIFDGGRSDNSSSRYSSKNNEHSYKPADREVKYRGHQRYPSSERYSGQAEFHNEPYTSRQEYVEHSRSDRGSSLEGVGVDDEFPDVMVVEPHDLRRKLLSEGDNEREGVSSERG